jgi:hypothetical protein
MASERNGQKPITRRECLSMAALSGVLLGGWIAWGRVATSDADDFLRKKPTPAAGYVRRETRPPLSPARFVGQTAVAYRIANEIPDILDQLYCYCECDKHLGHKSLLSCFTDDHGAG